MSVVPSGVADATDDGRPADGDIVVVVGFGAGRSRASAVLRRTQ